MVRKKWPWFIFQPLMREIDLIDLDIDALLDQVEGHGADAILVNSAGFMAWYPTEIKYQKINPYMQGDFLGDITEKAHYRGLKVVGRVDISKGYGEWYKKQKDWYKVDFDGNSLPYWGMYETCFTGDYWQKFNFSILEELLKKKYPLDGLFYNFFYFPVCYCERCSKVYELETGRKIPSPGEIDPIYESWRGKEIASYAKKIRDFARVLKPGIKILVYHHLRKGWQPEKMAKVLDNWVAQITNPLMPNMRDPQPRWPYFAAEEAKLGSALKKVPPYLILSFSEFFQSRRALQSPQRLCHDFVQGIAHGGIPLPALNGIPGQQEDPRPLEGVKETMSFLSKNRGYFYPRNDQARIALVRSFVSNSLGRDEGNPAGKKDSPGHIMEFRGFFEALIHSRKEFDLITDLDLRGEALQNYQLIILPCVECISSQSGEMLDRFVEKGGNLLLSANSASLDVSGVPWKKPPLKFFTHTYEKPLKVESDYLQVFDKKLKASLGGASIVGFSGDFWPFEEGNWEKDLFRVGIENNNNPEFTYWEKGQCLSNGPGLLWKKLGRGQVIWFPWRIGAIYHEHHIPEYQIIIAHILKNTVEEGKVWVEAAKAVESVVFEQDRESRRWIIFLINGAGPVERPLVETTPLTDIKIFSREKIKKAYSLLSGKELQRKNYGLGKLVEIEKLRGYEIIVFEK